MTLEQQLRDAKIRDALIRAERESLELLRQTVSKPAELSAEMMDKPETYRTRAESERLLRDREMAKLREAFRNQLQVFATHRPDLPADWVRLATEKHADEVTAALQGVIAPRFGALFTDARRLAVQTQRARVTNLMQPRPEELEKLVDSLEALAKTDGDHVAGLTGGKNLDLARSYAAAARGDQQLFEENDEDLTQRATALITRGLQLLRRQYVLVADHDGGGRVFAESIAARMREGLERTAAEDDLGLPVFPRVAEQVTPQAKKVERRLFESFVRHNLGTEGSCRFLDVEEVHRAVGDDFRRVPHDADTHRLKVRDQLASVVRAKLTTQYLSSPVDPLPEGGAEQLRVRFDGLMGEGGAAQAALNAGMAACVDKEVAAQRDRLADRELAAAAPAVADRSLEFNDAVLQRLDQDPVLASGDFPVPGRFKMKETAGKFSEAKRSLGEEGRRVVRSQKDLVDVDERKKRFEREILADPSRSADRKQFWMDEYRDEIVAEWRTARAKNLEENPATRAPWRPDKYDRIFPTTTKRIEEAITLAFDIPRPVQTARVQATPVTLQPTVAIARDPGKTSQRGEHVGSSPGGGPSKGPGGGGGPTSGSGEGTGAGPGGGGGAGGGPGSGGDSGRGGGNGKCPESACDVAGKKCQSVRANCGSEDPECRSLREGCGRALSACLAHLGVAGDANLIQDAVMKSGARAPSRAE